MTVDELTRTAYGEVFTRRWVVESLLDLVGYRSDAPLVTQTIVEPSVGSGAFIGPIVERLIASCDVTEVPLATLVSAIRGYDLRHHHVEASRALAASLLTDAGLPAVSAAEVAATWIVTGDFLLDDVPTGVDYVVGNPPYIRSDDLDDEVESEYRRRWVTMRGRADIYVGFFERGLGVLAPGGRLGFICADRWMRNAYGAGLRRLISDAYAVEHVWQMHDVDAFEAEVSAYPAVTVLRNGTQGPVAVIDTTAAFGEVAAHEATRFALGTAEQGEGVGFAGHRLNSWFEGGDLWPAGSPDRIALLEYLQEHFGFLEDPAKRTKIGIGVATGADKAFIATSDADVERGRLLPLVMADDIRSGRLHWRGKHLVNPWLPDGSLAPLVDYPRMSAHLASHEAVTGRYVAKRGGGESWHRTIDKVDHSLIARPKLLLQDMKATIQPVLEPGGLYPHHNLYYIVSLDWDLEVLGGILLSRIAQAFIEAYGVRMRGGTLRFQAQYLRTIRVPSPDGIDPEVAERLRAAFRARDVDAANRAAELAYGLPEGSI